MRVTFTCEKCGHKFKVREENWGTSKTTQGDRVLDRHVTLCAKVEAEPCPNCAKLTYGPLTEEMVAEALIKVADEWYKRRSGEWEKKVLYGYTDSMQADLSKTEARFVLRLLDKAPSAVDCLRENDQSTIKWRDWLLDLARGK